IQIDEWKRTFRVDFDEREILLVIGGDVVYVVSLAIVGRALDFQVRSALNHVLICHDVARRIDDEPGAQTLQGLANLARPAPVVAKKLRIKIFERIADRPPNYSFGINIHNCWQNFGYR